MLKRFAVLAGLTLLLGLTVVPAAHADTRFSIQIGPGYGYAPGPGYYWQDGYNAWSGYGYRRTPGRWVRGHGGRNWDRRWERDRRDFYRSWDNRGRNRDRGWNGDRDGGGYRDYDRYRNNRGGNGRRR